MKKIEIYTDGCCLGNPGKGGYAAILVYGEKEKILTSGFRKTTNNRMELLACVKALESLKEKCEVELYSDSKYIVDSIRNEWAYKWRNNNWMRNKKDAAENPDIWEKLLALNDYHTVSWNWVKGHSGHHYNERCDQLAKKAASLKKLEIDEYYEKQ